METNIKNFTNLYKVKFVIYSNNRLWIYFVIFFKNSPNYLVFLFEERLSFCPTVITPSFSSDGSVWTLTRTLWEFPVRLLQFPLSAQTDSRRQLVFKAQSVVLLRRRLKTLKPRSTSKQTNAWCVILECRLPVLSVHKHAVDYRLQSARLLR